MSPERIVWGVLLAIVCQAVTTSATSTTPPVCKPGFYGDQCTTACGHCLGSTPCNNDTGHCQACEPGYDFAADPRCKTACSAGLFGANCGDSCSTNCQNPGNCSNVDGSCSPCKAGWEGNLCTKRCDDYKYGDQCRQTCGQCSQGAVCDKATGHCPGQCNPGYDPTDPLCKSECAANKWDQNCTRTCGAYCLPEDSRQCDKVNGYCSCRPGYKTPYCTDECDDGAWGQDCQGVCSANCTDVCTKTNGWCTCQPGYVPKLCNARCDGGKYGQDCGNSCGSCHGGSTICNHVTGNCERCQDNWEMPLCQGCIAGHWGPTCGQRCGQCGGDGRCDQVTGNCLSSQCLDGWTSSTCDVKCSDGFYGEKCGLECGRCRNKSPCRHDNGICEQDCEDGYTGVLCKTEEESLVAPIVGSVFGAAALIAIVIVVVAVCYVKRFSSGSPQTPSKDFMDIDRTDSGTTNQHEVVSMRDSLVYQNMPETSGSGGINNSGYDQTSFSQQDTHAYAVHTPGKPNDQDPVHHTYQNTSRDGASTGEKPQKRNRGDGLVAPEATYGNVPPSLQPPEATYRNLSGGHGVYGNVK